MQRSTLGLSFLRSCIALCISVSCSMLNMFFCSFDTAVETRLTDRVWSDLFVLVFSFVL